MKVALRNDCINLCHMNAQSLCARQSTKFDEFKSCFTDSKLDLICVTETWLHDGILDGIITLDGYKMIRNDRKYCRGGGICIYYKTDLDYRIIEASKLTGQ